MKKHLFWFFSLLAFAASGQCDTATATSASGITAGSATITATLPGTATFAQVHYVRAGFTDTVVTYPQSTGVWTLTGLTASTQYIYYVQVFCSGGAYVYPAGRYYFTTLSAAVVYTPMTANGYNYKRTANDWTFHVPFSDTTLNGGLTRPGALVVNPADTGLYVWTGAAWQLAGGSLTSLQGQVNTKVDSVTIRGDTALCYWIGGVDYCTPLAIIWSNITNTPTTVAGYGITDVVSTVTSGLTTNYLPYFNGTGLANSILQKSGSNIFAATNPPSTSFFGGTGVFSSYAASATDVALYGYNNTANGGAVYGEASSGWGVVGYSSSGTGVFGFSETGVAIDANADLSGSIAVRAWATNSAGIPLRLKYGSGQADLKVNNLTTTRTFQFPDASGTIALTSDLSTYVNSLGAIGSTPNANGASISGNTLNLQPASASFGGVVTTGAQSFAGQKTFMSGPLINGTILFGTDNTYDVGASGATRPRDLHIARNVFFAGTLTGGSGSDIGWQGRSYLRSPADGQITMINSAANDFGRLNFGGTTSSFPALKRSGAALHVRLADDSDVAALVAGAITATGNHTFTSGSNNLYLTSTAFTADYSGGHYFQIGGNNVLVIGTSTISASKPVNFETSATPADPSPGNAVEWFDGTNKKWKKNVGGVITSGTLY